VLSGIGLWLLTHPRHSNRLRALGALSLALPHLIGAPAAPPPTTVPPAFAWRFAVTAIGTQAIFWLLLGALGGWAFNHRALVSAPRPGGVDERV
jgi:predicted cobalt transporter CbtA